MRSLQPNWGNPLMSHTKQLVSAILQFLDSVQSGHLKKKYVYTVLVCVLSLLEPGRSGVCFSIDFVCYVGLIIRCCTVLTLTVLYRVLTSRYMSTVPSTLILTISLSLALMLLDQYCCMAPTITTFSTQFSTDRCTLCII